MVNNGTSPDIQRLKDAMVLSVADFVAMCGRPRGQVRTMLVNSGLIGESNDSKKCWITVNDIRTKCPRLFAAMRSQLEEMRCREASMPALPTDTEEGVRTRRPCQLDMLTLTIADIANYSGLTRFQVRRRLDLHGLLPKPGTRKAISVLRNDLKRMDPELWDIIDSKRDVDHAKAQADAEFCGFGEGV